MSIEKIALPIDTLNIENISATFDSLAPALTFANSQRATVTLLSIVDQLSPKTDDEFSLSNMDLLEFVEKRESDGLSHLISHLGEMYPQVKFDHKVLFGIPFIQVIRLVEYEKYDLIVISSQYRRHYSSDQLSSMIKHLMRKSSVPVWATSNSGNDSLKHIMVTVDLISHDQENTQLNKRILNHGINLANVFDAKLTIFHAWHLYGESYLSTWGRKSPMEIALMAKAEKQHKEDMMTELLSSFHYNGKVDLILQEGNTEIEINKFVEQHNVDLIVMGTVCRTGISGYVIGNTAETIIDSVKCSALTVKPEGFTTPIALGDTA